MMVFIPQSTPAVVGIFFLKAMMSAWFTPMWLIVIGPIACEDDGNNVILGLTCGVACIVIVGVAGFICIGCYVCP